MKSIDFYSYMLGGLVVMFSVYQKNFTMFVDKLVDKIRGVLKRD